MTHDTPCDHDAGAVVDTRSGGASRDRTDDLRVANATLSQLSYGPLAVRFFRPDAGDATPFDARPRMRGGSGRS